MTTAEIVIRLEVRGTLIARSEEGAYWLYVTDEATQRAGMDRDSRWVNISVVVI